jgi:hypothetical protein
MSALIKLARIDTPPSPAVAAKKGRPRRAPRG